MMKAIPAPLIRVETFTSLEVLIQPMELPQQALTKLHLVGPMLTMMPF